MSNPGTYAQFTLGAQSFCVADAHVVQAVPYPADITRIPRTTGALHGVFMHRGQLVPLVDLAHWMGQSEVSGKPAGEALVLKANGVVLAIQVDAVKGLLRARADALQAVCHDGSAVEFFHSALLPEDGAPPLPVLDPALLAAQARIWCQAHPTAQNALSASALNAQQDNTTGGSASTLAMFRMGSTYIAITAAAVGEVSEGMPLQRMNGLGGDFLGMTRWRGHDVPVVNLCHMLNLPAPDATETSWLVLLHYKHHSLGFYVQALLSVGPVDAASMQTEVDLSPALKSVTEGSFVHADNSRVYVLCASALLESSPLSRAIARRVTEKAQASATQSNVPLLENRTDSSSALIVFRSGQNWATPMASMLEIIRADATQRQLLQQGQHLPGAMEWRKQAIPLTDMRQALCQQTTEDSEDLRIIVLQSNSGPRALLVERVEALIPGHLGARSRFKAARAEVEMITIGQGQEQKSYQLIDLQTVAAPQA